MLLMLAPQSRAQDAAAAAQESFAERVAPIIFKNCSGCHTSGGHAGGLRMDSYASIFKGGERGPVIVPGKPEASLIAQAVHYDSDPKMPPRGKLADADIAAIDKSIRE